jgi:hypothetical protein
MALMLTQGAERTAAWDAGAPDEVGTVREDSVGEGTGGKDNSRESFSEQVVYLWLGWEVGRSPDLLT